MTQSSFYFKQLEVGPMENFAYLLGDLENREAYVVDPAWQVDTFLNQAKADGMNIVGALISHHHYDHTNGLNELLEALDCKVYIHKQDCDLVDVQKSNLVKTDQDFKLQLGKFTLEFLHTPGHTRGSQCFLVHDHLITGDTLFIDGCGRCDLAGGDPEAMYYSLTQKVMALPDHTQIMPGHNYGPSCSASLMAQKQNNPYLRLAAESLKNFTSLRMHSKPQSKI